MKLLVGKNYKLFIKLGEQVLNFTATILEIDGDFITFKDKFGEVQSFRKDAVMSYSEVQNGN